MKRKKYLILLLFPFLNFSQKDTCQPVCSGSVSNSKISYVVGKIYVEPISKIEPTKVEDIETETTDNVTIYPNPVSENLFFEVKDKTPLKAIFIYSEDGKLVYSSKIESNKINVSFLSLGVYLVVFEGNSKTYKIIKK